MIFSLRKTDDVNPTSEVMAEWQPPWIHEVGFVCSMDAFHSEVFSKVTSFGGAKFANLDCS